jgi:glycosyltransferase involved in cell wall biosynthesis
MGYSEMASMPVDDLTRTYAIEREQQTLGRVSTSVVICAYTMQRWQDMCAAVDSVLAQEHPVDEVLLIIDHNDELFDAAVSLYGADSQPKVLRNNATRGLSGARNTGLLAASSDVVAFLDDDAQAESGWSRAMVAHYDIPDVEGVGGCAVPRWPVGRPWWLPAEFDWVVGCSYVGQPTAVAPVRNFLGCNMSMRRDAMVLVDGFDSAVGRVGSKPTGCEETELCIRISQRRPSALLVFDPDMRVLHTVSTERTTFRYFARRCYHEGRSKAMVSRLVGSADGLSSERTYVMKVLPKAVARGLASCGFSGLVRATVVIAGVVLTSLGYAKGRLDALSDGAGQ